VKTWHSRRAARYGRSPWSTRVYRRSPSKVSASSWSTRTTCSSGKSRSSVRPTLSTRADISRYTPLYPSVLFTVCIGARVCIYVSRAEHFEQRRYRCWLRVIVFIRASSLPSWLCRVCLRRVPFSTPSEAEFNRPKTSRRRFRSPRKRSFLFALSSNKQRLFVRAICLLSMSHGDLYILFHFLR